MDALLQDSTKRLIEHIRGYEGDLVYNKFKPYTDYTATIKRFRKSGFDRVIEEYEQAVLKDNLNVVGHITRKDLAIKIHERLLQLRPDLKIRVYHGLATHKQKDVDTNESKNEIELREHELKDVNTSWKKFQVVIYTGTISCGIDFSEEHFHKNISLHARNTSNSDQFI